MPVLPPYRNQSIDFHSKSIEICTANQLTGFYMRATLAFNGLKYISIKKTNNKIIKKAIIIHKIFEADSSFHVKQRTKRKV